MQGRNNILKLVIITWFASVVAVTVIIFHTLQAYATWGCHATAVESSFLQHIEVVPGLPQSLPRLRSDELLAQF